MSTTSDVTNHRSDWLVQRAWFGMRATSWWSLLLVSLVFEMCVWKRARCSYTSGDIFVVNALSRGPFSIWCFVLNWDIFKHQIRHLSNVFHYKSPNIRQQEAQVKVRHREPMKSMKEETQPPSPPKEGNKSDDDMNQFFFFFLGCSKMCAIRVKES